MSLIGSLSSGVGAMKSFVQGMNVIGNNIANVNTTGFKKQRTNYTDGFMDTLRDASAGGAGGQSNQAPIQVGSGVTLGGTQKLFEQGAVESTGVGSDLAISGDGFFRVYDSANNQQLLTRNGAFRVDNQGFLTDQNGFYLMGLTGGGANGGPSEIGPLRLDLEQDVRTDQQGRPIDELDRLVLADGSRALPHEGSPTGFYRSDAEGRLLDADDRIILSDADGVSLRAAFDETDGVHYLRNADGDYVDEDGDVVSDPADRVVWNSNTHPPATPEDGSAAQFAEYNPGSSGGLPSVAAPDVNDPNQFALAIQSWSIGRDGALSLSLNDGTSYIRGQVLLQQVSDPDALTQEGNSLFSGFAEAGPLGRSAWAIGGTMSAAEIAAHAPNQGGVGFIQSRALESSNVDLTDEFAGMISTQRAFQAGSRIITVSDEMLQEIINLKR